MWKFRLQLGILRVTELFFSENIFSKTLFKGFFKLCFYKPLISTLWLIGNC